YYHVFLFLLFVFFFFFFFFFSSRRRHTRFDCDWSSDVCSSAKTLFFRFFLHLPFTTAAMPYAVIRLSVFVWASSVKKCTLSGRGKKQCGSERTFCIHKLRILIHRYLFADYLPVE